MLITWSCPRCTRTYSSTLRESGNTLVCAKCKWTWYLSMVMYEPDRQQTTKIVKDGLETKEIPIDMSE